MPIHPEMQALLGTAAMSKNDHDKPRPWCATCRKRVDFFLIGREGVAGAWWFVAKCHGAAMLVRPHWGDMLGTEEILRMIRLFKTRTVR